MAARSRFAPLSSAPSTLISFAAGYFVLSGAGTLLVIGIALAGQALGWDAVADLPLQPLGTAIIVLSAIGWIWTGALLARGVRLGGVLALTFTLLPDAVALAQRQPISASSLVWTALGVAVVALVWRDLR